LSSRRCAVRDVGFTLQRHWQRSRRRRRTATIDTCFLNRCGWCSAWSSPQRCCGAASLTFARTPRHATQHYATRLNATQRNATQRNATQRNARNATQRNATQRNATQRNATQRNATQRNATQRNAACHTTPRHDTQHNATQPPLLMISICSLFTSFLHRSIQFTLCNFAFFCARQPPHRHRHIHNTPPHAITTTTTDH
jgi:hypothetical protein